MSVITCGIWLTLVGNTQKLVFTWMELFSQSDSHLSKFFIYSCSSFESASFQIFLYNTQSSANRRTGFQNVWKHYCKLYTSKFYMYDSHETVRQLETRDLSPFLKIGFFPIWWVSALIDGCWDKCCDKQLIKDTTKCNKTNNTRKI